MLKALSVAVLVAVSSFQVAAQVSIPTRFGALTTNKNDNLTFKGKAVAPEVTVFSEAYVLQTFALRDSDVVLVSQAAGTTCPGQYVFVTVTPSAATVSPVFGTCYDETSDPVLQGQVISFTQPKVKGKGSVKFTYNGGVVYQDGKAVK